MKYYSAIKRNELLICATWMNLKCIMINERNQTKESTYCMMPMKYNYQKVVAESRSVVAWEQG